MTRRVRPLLPYAEASLVTLTVVTALTFWRLFDSIDFFPRLAAFALASHGVAIFTRRRGVSLPVSGAISIVAAVVVTGIVLFPSTTVAGIPTATTLGAIRDGFGDLWTQFQEVKAPSPVTVPFLLAAGVGLWWAAFVADWAAFRLWVPFESIVPSSTVFIFASLFAAERGRAAATGMFLAAAIGFLLVHRVTRQQSSGGWVSTDVQRATNSLLQAGAWLGGAAIVVAMILGPSLPDATADGVVDWRNAGEENTRLVDDPFIDIKSQLLRLSDKEVFTVVSNGGAYWRLTALDEFDGERWRANGSYDGAKRELPKKFEGGDVTRRLEQRFTITALDKEWVPAAFEARAFDTDDAEVQWDKDTATLIVVKEVDNSNGLAYDVVSEVPTPNADLLRGSTAEVAEDVQEQYTRLPENFSAAVRALAEQITADEPTVYDKVLALQNYLRENYTYSLDVSIGEDVSAIEDFLFNVKSGYCQQFAGSFGAMARSVGIPTRIAVGYTQGEQDENGVYHVKGRYAHAWPEVFIGGFGWIPFEPTTGRGSALAESYTGVRQEQAATTGAGTVTVPTSPNTTPAGGVDTGPRDPEGGLGDAGAEFPEDLGAGARNDDDDAWWEWDRSGRKITVGGGVLTGLLILYVITVPIAFAVWRHRRRKRATEPADQVRVAWAESVELLGTIGLRQGLSETPAEFAARAGRELDSDLLWDVAPRLEAADFSQQGVSEEDAEAAWAAAKELTATVRGRASRKQWLKAAFDPRPPDRRRPRRTRHGPIGVRADAPAIEVVQMG